MPTGVYIGIDVGNIVIPYWNPLKPLAGESVNFWAKGRSGLTISDTIGSDNITIETPSLYLPASAGAYITSVANDVTHRVLDGNSYTLYIKIKKMANVAGAGWESVLGLWGLGSNTAGRGIVLFILNNNLILQVTDGVASKYVFNVIADVNAVLTGIGWFELFMEIDYSTKVVRLQVINSGGNVINTTAVNLDISTLTFNNDNNIVPFQLTQDKFAYCNWKKYLGLKTIAQCRLDSYVTDLQLWFPELLSGTDVSGNAKHLTPITVLETCKHYSNQISYNLDKGFSFYQRQDDSYYADQCIPYDINGNEIVRTITGYTKRKTVAGDLLNHNLTDSLLYIPEWDRSDAIKFSDQARGTLTYYDVANPTKWHITELNSIVFNGFLNTNKIGTSFVKCTVNSNNNKLKLQEAFGFATNKTGNDLNKVLKYTNDYKAPFVSGGKGQLVMTWDDIFVSSYTTVFPLYIQKGVVGTFYITGTVIGSNLVFARVKELQEMYAGGMDIQCHTYDHTNLTTLSDVQVDAEYSDLNTKFISWGYKIPEHTAYPSGSFNAAVKLRTALARKTARIVGGTVPFDCKVGGFDKMAVPSYNIDGLDAAMLATLKGKLDTAAANNTTVLTLAHATDALGGQPIVDITLLGEAIDYAKALGMDIIGVNDLYTLMVP
jgi:peptidoglycan/xylan/chitin deacetylase (PgdA/CDA1 family)